MEQIGRLIERQHLSMLWVYRHHTEAWSYHLDSSEVPRIIDVTSLSYPMGQDLKLILPPLLAFLSGKYKKGMGPILISQKSTWKISICFKCMREDQKLFFLFLLPWFLMSPHNAPLLSGEKQRKLLWCKGANYILSYHYKPCLEIRRVTLD